MTCSFTKIIFLVLLIGSIFSCRHLKKQEIARIEYRSVGDFGSEESGLLLLRNDSSIKATLAIKGGTTYTANIGQQELDYFYSFLKEVQALKEQTGYCTTSVSCIVYIGNKTVHKTKIDCRWNGFEYLKGVLFKGQGIGKIFRYDERISDPAIDSRFNIRYGDYEFYFNVEQVSSWCNKMMNSKDGLEPMYKSIKREVNHEQGDYYADNHSWLMTLFTPRIVNITTKEEGKALLIRLNDTLTANRTFFVITPQQDTVKIFGSGD